MGLSTSQFISVVLAPLSLFMLFYLRRAAGARASEIRHGARPDVDRDRPRSSPPTRRASASIGI